MLSESPALHVLQLEFQGKSLDLLTVLGRLDRWTANFPAIPPMSKEDYRARDAIPSTSGPAIGTHEPWNPGPPSYLLS